MLTPREAYEYQIDAQIRDCCRNGENPVILVKTFGSSAEIRDELLANYRKAGWKIELIRNDTMYQFSA